MSLDVNLLGKQREVECICLDCGQSHTTLTSPILYSSNITHNLGKMAKEAGIYQHLWRPEELRIKTAGELIEQLEVGLAKLKADPKKYEAFNAENGWGLYEHFVPFVEEYLQACKENPDSLIEISR